MSDGKQGLMERMLSALSDSNEQAARWTQMEEEALHAEAEDRADREKHRAEAERRAEQIAADRERMLIAGERQAAALEEIAGHLGRLVSAAPGKTNLPGGSESGVAPAVAENTGQSSGRLP